MNIRRTLNVITCYISSIHGISPFQRVFLTLLTVIFFVFFTERSSGKGSGSAQFLQFLEVVRDQVISCQFLRKTSFILGYGAFPYQSSVSNRERGYDTHL